MGCQGEFAKLEKITRNRVGETLPIIPGAEEYPYISIYCDYPVARYMRYCENSFLFFSRRCSMNETDIQQRFHLMQREIEATATLSKDAKIDLIAAGRFIQN